MILREVSSPFCLLFCPSILSSPYLFAQVFPPECLAGSFRCAGADLLQELQNGAKSFGRWRISSTATSFKRVN